MTDKRPVSDGRTPDERDIPATPLEIAGAAEGVDVEAAEEARRNMTGKNAPIAVFEATSQAEGQIVRGLLDSEGIPAIFEPLPGLSMTDEVILGETFNGVVLVAPEDAERAAELIAAYAKGPADEDEADSEPAA